MKPSVARQFYAWTGPRPVAEVNGRRLMSPVLYHRVDSFQSLHLADPDAVAALLPTGDLHPVTWFDGRAAVMIWALRHHEVTGVDVTGGPPGVQGRLRPYGEVGVIALVSRRPLRRGLPLLRPAMPDVGGFVLHLPVTTAEARDVGRVVFGLPKFVADMDFAETPVSRTVTVSESDREVLTATVHVRGRVRADHSAAVMYSVLDGRLLRTVVPTLGHRRVAGRHSGDLRLGDHPVADTVRALDVDPSALMTASHLDYRMILPWGAPVGVARTAYPGYAGSDRASGRLTITYPHTGPIDLYAVPEGVAPPVHV